VNKKLVLLIEDDAKVNEYNRYQFEEEGFEVETAATLLEARQAASGLKKQV